MNILLVSDDSDLANEIEEKLVFLRADDKVIVSSYDKAMSNMSINDIRTVLVCESEHDKTIDILKNLRSIENLSLILVANTYELVIEAGDIGVDDFIMASSNDFEYVMRIVNNLKFSSLKQKFYRNEKLLEQLKLIDELTGLYTRPKLVIENAIDKDLLVNGVYMAISPVLSEKPDFDISYFANILKKSVRAEDILSIGSGTKFYIFMPNTDINGGITVLNKIQDECKYQICAGLADIAGKTYEEFENSVAKSLAEALSTGAQYVVSQDEVKEEWMNEDVKNYKIFRQMFQKKLEKEITPVFYKLQQIYEEKLFGTEIDQFINDKQCVFRLKNKDRQSTLNIIYPGFAKVIIDIKHEGLDSPENKELQLSLSKVTQEEIENIVERFINEFKSNL